MSQLVKQKIIDKLVLFRNQFIEANLKSILFHQEALRVCSSIDDLIPQDNSGYLDPFDITFHLISKELGEDTKYRVRPKEASIQHKSESEIRDILRKTVDGRLWITLFNRLGIFKLMSNKQQKSFKHDCNLSPAPFCLDVIESTLGGIYENRDTVLMQSLIDTFTSLSGMYASNNKRKFAKKIIINGAFFEYGSRFKLQRHEGLESLITVIWHWVLANKLTFDEKGISRNGIWDELSDQIESVDLDYCAIRSIKTHGIEFRFYQKKTVHVIFSESITSLLNDQLARTKALPAS